MNRFYKTISFLFLFAGNFLSAFGWGQKGHDTVCYIAENHLTPVTKSAVEELLGGKSMVYYANWLDNASHTHEYEYTKTWHYKNIDAGVEFEEAPLLETGDIIRAIREQAAALGNPEIGKEEKALVLKMLIHFLGDIHQPMHVGHASDRGGNQWNVRYFNKPTNLHTVWDSNLPESAHNWSYTEWQQQLDRLSEDAMLEIIIDGTPEKWGKECLVIATQIYDNTPVGSNLSYDYISQWTPVVEEQFMRGGLRLADLLNSIFDADYKAWNKIIK